MPGCRLEIVANPSPSGQHSLLIDAEHAVEVAKFLRDDRGAASRLLLERDGRGLAGRRELTEKVKVKKLVEGVETGGRRGAEDADAGISGGGVSPVFDGEEAWAGGAADADGGSRRTSVHLPSLTPVWRSAEFQEREIFDLYGMIFDGHPDLRRILMWDGFEDHPMRKDYVEPDDYEYEPTAHDEVLRGRSRMRARAMEGRR